MDNDGKFVHYRAVPAELHLRAEPLPNGARQMTGRLVPYNVVATVLDETPAGREIYQEGFRPGAFDGQVTNGSTNRGILSKISLIHRHEGGLGFLGPFVALREMPDGLWGDANVVPSKADDVAALIRDGVQELSIEFRVPKADGTSVTDDGVRWRTRAYLEQVALEPKGAYSTAQVLAFRKEVEEAELEEAEAAAEKSEADQALELAEATQAAVLQRRQQWDELTGRIDALMTEQEKLVRHYGVTQPGGRFDNA